MVHAPMRRATRAICRGLSGDRKRLGRRANLRVASSAAGRRAHGTAVTLTPLGITLDGAAGAPGPDLGFLAKRGVPWIQLAQDATDLFDHHHSANDTLDKIDPASLNQNVAAYATYAWLAANVP